MDFAGGFMWDERYGAEEYAYGTEPNDFLFANAAKIPVGKVLCVAEGEGRNAVYLAGLGHQVTAVDSSVVGLEKAKHLASRRKVELEIVPANLAKYEIAEESWDGVVSIFCHLPPEMRKKLHKRLVKGLKPGGVLVLEAYTPKQLKHRTGGPQSEEMMMTLAGLRDELAGLELIHACEVEREVVEGLYHTGKGAVVQVTAVKPAS